MSRIKVVSLAWAVGVTILLTRAASNTEDAELRDLDVNRWECTSQRDGQAQTQDVRERNRMKNRSPIDLSEFSVESLDTDAFLNKVRRYDSQIQGSRRNELTAAQKDQLDSGESQIVSLTGWLVFAYPGGVETANCRSSIFRDWHLEVFAEPSDHAPRIGDATPIICEITPRTERCIYRDGTRIKELAGFLRLQDLTYRVMAHKPKKIRVTGYLMWDNEHRGSEDVGTTVRYFSTDGFHHPWRSTAWEIHPTLKIEMIK